MHPDVLIIGGGVIGLTTAWQLAGEGVRVAVAEQGEIGRQASWAGAGMLPPGCLAHAHTPLDLLRAHSSRLHAEMSAQLLEQTGQSNGYVVCGGVELPNPHEPHREPPTDEWHSEGVAFHHVERAILERWWPGLTMERPSAVLMPDMAQIRNPWHLAALRMACERRGVWMLTGWTVSRLVVEGSRVTAVEGEQGKLSAGQVLLAAGAWSDALLAQVGHRPGIRPVRGQIALLNTAQRGLRPLLLVGKRYLVPRADGRVLVGSTEEDAGFDARPTAGGIRGLLDFATALVPPLREAHLEQSWAGLRPGSVDGLPYLGGVPGYDNLHIAAGHFRAGLHLSAVTGLVMMQHLLGRPTLVPLEAFRLDRAGSA